MQPVSDGFKAAIAASSRKTRARVRLEVLDNDAWLDNTKQVSSEALLSRTEQLTNRVRETPGAYATLEPGRWKLDGSFVIPPRPEEMLDVEIGWWSEVLCDAAGVFDPPQAISITCGHLYNAAGITVTFDPAANEYAADFVITAYDANGNIIHREEVVGNTNSKYLLDRNISQFKRVELIITRWCNGYRRARVVEIDFGIIEDYGEDNLLDLSLINESDPSAATVPLGELRFSLDNSDRRFVILNPTGIYYFLQRRQKVTVELGVEVNGVMEYVKGGTYYLKEWKSDHEMLSASFVARDRIDLLTDIYRRGTLEVVSAYELAEDILIDAGIEDYSIDPALQAVELIGCVPLVSHRDALQLVAQAARAVVRMGVDGCLYIERLAAGEPVAIIDLDNAYSTPEITLDELVTAVTVDVVGYQVKNIGSTVYTGTMNIDGQAEVWVEYRIPCQDHAAVVTGGTLVDASHYAYASKLVISGVGPVQISITADEMEPVRSIYTLQDDTKPANEQPQTLAITNPLVGTTETAADVAEWLLSEAKKRLTYNVDWRQNPALECGDIVTIEDEFGQNRPARITRQEFEYAGYISGRTRAKGGGS